MRNRGRERERGPLLNGLANEEDASALHNDEERRLFSLTRRARASRAGFRPRINSETSFAVTRAHFCFVFITVGLQM